MKKLFYIVGFAALLFYGWQYLSRSAEYEGKVTLGSVLPSRGRVISWADEKISPESPAERRMTLMESLKKNLHEMRKNLPAEDGAKDMPQSEKETRQLVSESESLVSELEKINKDIGIGEIVADKVLGVFARPGTGAECKVE